MSTRTKRKVIDLMEALRESLRRTEEEAQRPAGTTHSADCAMSHGYDLGNCCTCGAKSESVAVQREAET
jgi:hypothetical protein